MIASFRDKWLEEFFERSGRSKKIPANLEKILRRKLQLLDDAATDADLRTPPSNRFKQLSGSLEGYCAIRVNERWRLCFRWKADGGEASDVYLDDHSYE
jgi:proteic killer suppression protein